MSEPSAPITMPSWDEVQRVMEAHQKALAEASENVKAYWTVLELIGERFPDCPIGDYPGCIDELREALKRAREWLDEVEVLKAQIAGRDELLREVIEDRGEAEWSLGTELVERIEHLLKPEKG